MFKSVAITGIGRPVEIAFNLEIEGKVKGGIAAGPVVERVLIVLFLQRIVGAVVADIAVDAQVEVGGAEADAGLFGKGDVFIDILLAVDKAVAVGE